MKRLHIHLSVDQIKQNIEFYSTLFGAQPSIVHEDYAKWMLDDPKVNFAISNRGSDTGLDHLGIQVENDQELRELKGRLESTQQDIDSQENTACCYSKSDKHWITDPQGIAWESFHTLADIPTFNESNIQREVETSVSACCIPVKEVKSSCCG